jgi:glutamine synthetase
MAQHLPRVPYTLREAIDLFANSDFTRQVFGQEVVKHYTHYFQVEQKAYDSFVTDWERQRYFERI